MKLSQEDKGANELKRVEEPIQRNRSGGARVFLDIIL